MINDAVIKAIIEISNNDKVIKMVEPGLMCHTTVEEWMVRRIFKAVDLLQEAWGNECKHIRETKSKTGRTKKTTPIT